jgi:6,7-dimethyl-8-ribityllumazine synthase
MAAEAHTPYTYAGEADHSRDRIGLVVAKWHQPITEFLAKDAHSVLEENGVQEIALEWLPGSYELPFGASVLARSERFDAILALGVVIKGETRHDEFINHAIAQRLMDISYTYGLPVLNGVLTTDNLEQAQARAEGPKERKGLGCAIAALEMIDLVRRYEEL